MAARRDPLTGVANTLATPQTKPIPGREADMKRNDAGGYSFTKDTWNKVEDFLILGTCGGTFYLGERELTLRNTDVILAAVREDATRVAEMARDINVAIPARAPKPQPQLFALAAVFALGDDAGKQAAREAFTQMVRTTDHLTHVVGYYKTLRNKTLPGGRNAPVTGPAFLKALRAWFLTPPTEDVAWRTVKARQRATAAGERMEVADVLRLSHPKPDTAVRDALFGWLTGKATDEEARAQVPAIDRFLKAQAAGTAGAVELITAGGVPWEYLPTGLLNEPQVWEALAPKAGLRAVMRNLSRMSRIDAITPFGSTTTGVVTARLRNPENVTRARIHPLEAWLTQKAYAAGVSQPHKSKPPTRWTVNGDVVDALDSTFEAGFGAVTPSGKRLLVAVDCSGSMSYEHTMANGTNVGSAYQAANTIAVIMARTEPNAHFIEFDYDDSQHQAWSYGYRGAASRAGLAAGMDRGVYPSKVTPKTQLKEIAGWQPRGGGTDCSLPIKYALTKNLKVDGFLLLTDSETWAGSEHASETLAAYRRSVNPDARLIVASLTAAGHSVGDPKDPGVLNMAGLDASLPTVVAGFLR